MATLRSNKLNINKLITVDNTGMPCAPKPAQLLDKDILTLYTRDTTPNKVKYIAECGVIYYLGDPNSPAGQSGLSRIEALAMAIDNFNLPKNYKPDALVDRLIDRYYAQNITEAGIALENIRKSIHLVNISITKINEFLNNKLSSSDLSFEVIKEYTAVADIVSKKATEIPTLLKSLNQAYENLRFEEESNIGRGGKEILSSMNASEGEWSQ